jgi:hypothetical protein
MRDNLEQGHGVGPESSVVRETCFCIGQQWILEPGNLLGHHNMEQKPAESEKLWSGGPE